MDNHAQLARWRHLIEPELLASASPLSWAELLDMPVKVLERSASVMVTHDSVVGGELVQTVLVACGELQEVRDMVPEMENLARIKGIGKVIFVGRRGWLRIFTDYREIAVLGQKEL